MEVFGQGSQWFSWNRASSCYRKCSKDLDFITYSESVTPEPTAFYYCNVNVTPIKNEPDINDAIATDVISTWREEKTTLPLYAEEVVVNITRSPQPSTSRYQNQGRKDSKSTLLTLFSYESDLRERKLNISKNVQTLKSDISVIASTDVWSTMYIPEWRQKKISRNKYHELLCRFFPTYFCGKWLFLNTKILIGNLIVTKHVSWFTYATIEAIVVIIASYNLPETWKTLRQIRTLTDDPKPN